MFFLKINKNIPVCMFPTSAYPNSSGSISEQRSCLIACENRWELSVCEEYTEILEESITQDC